MSSNVVIAINMQMGYVSPDGHQALFHAVDVIEKLSKNGLNIVAACSTINSADSSRPEEMMWQHIRDSEFNAFYPPLIPLLDGASRSIIVESESDSAWTPSVKHFVRAINAESIFLIGLDDGTTIIPTIADILDDGKEAFLVQDALSFDLDLLPINQKALVNIIHSTTVP